MAKEGSTEAPIRHPLDFNHPDFLDPKKLDDEMRRAFDICHGCRRCFNLCDSFPKLFDLIDESENEDVDSLKSEQFKPVVDACTLCDMCFMTKCPYVPPHEFNLDFPHLMLRYRTAQKKNNELPKIPYQLAKIDRNGKIGVLFSKLINWMSDIKNNLFRKIFSNEETLVFALLLTIGFLIIFFFRQHFNSFFNEFNFCIFTHRDAEASRRIWLE